MTNAEIPGPSSREASSTPRPRRSREYPEPPPRPDLSNDDVSEAALKQYNVKSPFYEDNILRL